MFFLITKIVFILTIILSDNYNTAQYVNVALNKPAYHNVDYNDSFYSPKLGVDEFIDECKFNNEDNKPFNDWFIVDLVHDYQVKYVVVYSRMVKDDDHKMDNFIVGLTNNFDPELNKPERGKYDLCGQWPSEALPPGLPMRVNCSNVDKFSRFVIIQQKIGRQYLGFNELEVYTDEFSECTTNLALFKNAYQSSVYESNSFEFGPNFCVDGKMKEFCHIEKNADLEDWFAVDLAEEYQIKYIVFYGRGDCCYERMDSCIVGLTNNFDPNKNTTIRGNYEICGYGPAHALPGAQPVRVDCKNTNIYSRFVIIQQSEGRETGMGFLELEVYGGNLKNRYFGCYKNFVWSNSFLNISPHTCLQLCRSHRQLFSSIKNSDCFCGNVSEPAITPSKCVPICQDDGSCAEHDGHIVFEVNKSPGKIKLGCFLDNPATDFDSQLWLFRTDMTIKTCIDYCFQHGYPYAALQNHYSCFCGNSYGRFGNVPDQECSQPCSKNLQHKCDDDDCSTISLYSTCYMRGSNKTCQERYHCSKFAELGSDQVCESNICEPGWKGDYCDERDCNLNNGNCGPHKCMDFIIGTFNVSECVCNAGYQKMYAQDDCTDIDECSVKLDLCNRTVSNCNNTVGSYECICSPGYQNFNPELTKNFRSDSPNLKHFTSLFQCYKIPDQTVPLWHTILPIVFTLVIIIPVAIATGIFMFRRRKRQNMSLNIIIPQFRLEE